MFNILSELKGGDEFKATIQKNEEFHLPINIEHVFIISNGTGIAPFLGMIDEVNANIKSILFGEIEPVLRMIYMSVSLRH
ncbi:hypothetical protein KH5_14820 [Urechidicola sp. KH5]